MAIYMNSKTGPVPLDQIIAAADACNHAIPTTKEINHALSKLLSLGIVEASDGCITLNSTYVEALDEAWHKPGGLFEVPNKGRNWLQKNWPGVSVTTTTDTFSNKQVNAAYRRYRDRISGNK